MKTTSFAEKRCSVARSLEQVGPWWSLLIIRDAMMGVRRFREFERSLGIAKNTLAKRLAHLVDSGILKKVPSSSGSAYEEYELTKKGADLSPIVMALAQWGDKWAVHEDGPSFEMIDQEAKAEISRIWPRRADGEAIPLRKIVLHPHVNDHDELTDLPLQSGEMK